MTAAPAYRIDGRPASREGFYAAACDPSRSVVVEACAGAGKTWMLVSRILRALLEGAKPQEVLAITFTRKAAGEMRQRLNDWLEAFGDARCGDAEREAALRMRGMDAAQARLLAPRLAGLQAELLQSGRAPQIHTFHRWFFQLLRAAPLELLGELGLSADMQLVEDWADHESEVYRRFHAAVMQDPSLRDDFDTLVGQHGRGQLRKWLDAAWQKRVELALTDAAGRLEDSVPPAASQWAFCAGLVHPSERLDAPLVRQALDELACELCAKSGATAQKQGGLLRQALSLPGGDAPGRLQAVRAALYTAAGTLRKNIDTAGLPLAAAHLDDIHAACEQQDAHERHMRMVRLSRRLLGELAAYKRQRGLTDMADLELCALRLLRDASLSGWVQERLDTQVRYLLVDEFQDTSPLQWHALHAWLSSYAGAGGGASGARPPSVFIVGDPKQSIYRFRRAEPKVFEAAQAFVRQALDGLMLACDHTHRNAPGVLSAVNAVFGAAQSQGEYAGFRPHTTEKAALGAEAGQGAVWALPPDDGAGEGDGGPASASAAGDDWRDSLATPRVEPEEARRQAEARQVARAVAQLVREEGVPPRDIKVLSRKRAVLAAVQQELQALGLPFAAVGDYRLAGHIVARDLLALLDALVSPQHRLSLAHALRSPVFGVGDDDLTALAEASRASQPPGHWWAALMAMPAPSPALGRAAALLSRWQAAARQLPPHDLLDRIVSEGEVAERVAAAFPASARRQALAVVDALLEQSLTLDGARYATPYRFVRALRRRAIEVAAPVPAQAVELLTVHGAKGLESPWVFLMDTDPPPPAADTVTALVDWPVEEAAPLVCGFVYATRQCPPSLQPLLAREQEARLREELNGLYVAMTRAESQLVVSATPGASRKAASAAAQVRLSWWQRLLPLSREWGQRPRSAAAQVAGEAEESTDWLWTLPVLSAPIDAGEDVSAPGPAAPDDGRLGRLGEAVHLALQWASGEVDRLRLGAGADAGVSRPGAAASTALPDISPWAEAAARSHGAPADEVVRHARAIWHNPDCERFFTGAALRWAGNEVPVPVEGRTLRIDRLVALGESGGAAAGARAATTWWVLDYKHHAAPHRVPEYRAQLSAYGRAVLALQPGDAVRCAFIAGGGGVVEVPLD